jgi:hypothetical protein
VDRHPVLDFRRRACSGLLARAGARTFRQLVQPEATVSPPTSPGPQIDYQNGVAGGFPRHPLHPRSSTR